MELSGRQLELLRALYLWTQEHHRSPSVRELAARLERSPATVHQHLKTLEQRGFLHSSGQAHGVELLVGPRRLGLRDPPPACFLPLKGWLQPGDPLRPVEGDPPLIPVLGLQEEGDYLLQIEGDRRLDEGFVDGDYVVVRPEGSGDGPKLVRLADGTLDLHRVQRMASGELSLLPARLRIERRNQRRPSPGALVVGRILRVMRIFEED